MKASFIPPPKRKKKNSRTDHLPEASCISSNIESRASPPISRRFLVPSPTQIARYSQRRLLAHPSKRPPDGSTILPPNVTEIECAVPLHRRRHLALPDERRPTGPHQRREDRTRREESETQHPGEQLPFAFGGNEKRLPSVDTGTMWRVRRERRRKRWWRIQEPQELGCAEESPFAHSVREVAKDAPRLGRRARIWERVKRTAVSHAIRKSKAPPESSTRKRNGLSRGAKKNLRGTVEDSTPPQPPPSPPEGQLMITPAHTAAPNGGRSPQLRGSRGKPKSAREKISQPSNVPPKGRAEAQVRCDGRPYEEETPWSHLPGVPSYRAVHEHGRRC